MQGETRILFRFFYLFLKDFLYKLLIFHISKKGVTQNELLPFLAFLSYTLSNICPDAST